MHRRGWMSLVSAAAVVAAVAPNVARAVDAPAAPEATPLKQVLVRVELVDAPANDCAKADKDIPAGDDHDALLLAALVKGGAQPNFMPEVTTTDEVQAITETSVEVPYDTSDGQHHSIKAVNRLDVTPHCNANGTIRGDFKIQTESFVASPGSSPIPSKTSRVISTECTLHDGETRLFRDMPIDPGADRIQHLVFVKMMTAGAKP